MAFVFISDFFIFDPNSSFRSPANRELDLKKAAAAAGEKNISMIKSKELLELTGYIHGGCSPVGMKQYPSPAVQSKAHNKVFPAPAIPSPDHPPERSHTLKKKGEKFLCFLWKRHC